MIMKFTAWLRGAFKRQRRRLAYALSPWLDPRIALLVAGLRPVAGGASEPFEVQVGPADIYFAPIGEPFPDVDTAPAGNWDLLVPGTRITEDGITIATQVQDTRIFSLGSVAPIKAGIVQRQFTAEFNVMDLSAEAVALAFGADPADVVDTPAGGGSPGTKAIALPASPTPQGWAVLLRWNQSAEGDGFNSQIEIKSAVQVGAAGLRFHKADPNALAFALVALYTDANWVRFVTQDAAPSP